MKKITTYLVAGAILVACFIFGEWVFMSDNSTFQNYFLYHTALPNFWRTLNTLPYFVGIMTSGNVHQASPMGYYAAATIQWFILGIAILAVTMRLKTKRT